MTYQTAYHPLNLKCILMRPTSRVWVLKTEFMLIGSRLKMSTLSNPPELSIANVRILQVPLLNCFDCLSMKD